MLCCAGKQDLEKGQTLKSTLRMQERTTGIKHRAVRWGKSGQPILYRSKLFPAISHSSPSILLDVVGNDGEKSVFFSLYHMTYRYNPTSSWLVNLQSFLADIPPKDNREGEMSSEEPPQDDNSLTRVRLA